MICTFSLSAQYNLTVDSDGTTLGPFNAVPAGFGSVTSGCDDFDLSDASYKLVSDASGLPTACDTITEDLTGLVALIDRGACEFGRKALYAQQAGAVAVIVCNNNADAPFSMAGGAFGDQVTIPTFMISQADCATFRDAVGTISISAEGEDFDPRDVVLWGANGEGSFDGGLNGWTPVNYVQCAADTTGDFSLWQWRPLEGANRGAYVGGAGSVNSPSSCNGVAAFDSDFYDNDGVAGNFGAGPCAANQAGALISPSIDLSGSADVAGVAVTFYQALRQFQSSFWVGWSTDGGVTWDSTQINQEYEVNSANIQDIERVNLPSSVIGASNLQIKFTLAPANYYYWSIDDVRIVEREANNLRVNDFFAIPANAITPQSQVDAFGFLADVENIGALAQDDVNLNLTIFNEDGDVVFTDDVDYGTIASDSLAENVPFAETFTPSELGLYQGIYTISSDNDDFNEEDNQQSFNFIISDTTFSKDIGVNLGTLTPADITTWSAGNYYFVPNGDGYTVTSVDFGIGNPADIVGLTAIVTVSEWNDDNEDGVAQVDERILLGFKEFEIEDEAANFANMSFNEEDDEPILLKDSTGYLVMIGYNGPIGFVEASGLNYDAFQFLADQNGMPSHRSFFNIATADIEADYNPLANVPFVRMNVNTTPVNVEETLTAEHDIKLFPNPATTQLTLDLDLQEVSKDVRLRVFDMMGRLVSQTRLENISNQEFNFNTSTLQAGVYVMEITTDFGVRSVQFEIAK